MREIFLIAALFSFMAAKSQTPGIAMFPMYSETPVVFNHSHDSIAKKKWFVTTYAEMSTGISFFKGGSATYLAAPLGLQLNRRINNNLYAFANVSIVPSFTTFNGNFGSNSFNKGFGNSPYMTNSFDIHPAASLGLMYVNDARTFSISGSVSAERSYYPASGYSPPTNYHQGQVIRSAHSDN
ncbi:MAG TPA: hypothetical protein VIJ75_11470 [Hanamia sp.]